MRYKVGDKVKIVSLQSVLRGGGKWLWEESNLELIENIKPNTSKVIETNKGETEMNATKVETTSPKFKKGDKVKVVGETTARDVETGKIYTVKNPRSHLGLHNGKLHNYVTLEEDDVRTPNEDCLELYIEPRSYRNMKPTDLIKVSIDGFEDEIPLGDLIHTLALLSSSTGLFGYRFFKMLRNLDEDKVTREVYELIRVSSKQEELMKDFFVIEAYKANLKELISSKRNELKELQHKLNQLN